MKQPKARLTFGISASLALSMNNFATGVEFTDYCPYDGLHPDPLCQALIASTIISNVSAVINGGGGTVAYASIG